MAERRLVILCCLVTGNILAVWATPEPYTHVTGAGAFYLLAVVYAQLTRPRDLP